jgi:sulfoxide reductase heme-binding subunit YedZ
MGVTTAPLDWYTARASGVVAYVLLTLVVLVGLTLSSQVRLPRWPRFTVSELHRFAGLLASVFIIVHVATIALDSDSKLSLSNLVVPLTASYRPIWTALGVVAIELLAALALTNLLRTRIPYRWWRSLHTLNLVVWGAASAHAIGDGTDSQTTWLTALYLISVSFVAGALVWRLARRRLPAPLAQALAGAAAVVGIATVLGLGSLTPTTSATTVASSTTPSAFADNFSGSLTQQFGNSGTLLSVIGSGTGARHVLVRIDLATNQAGSLEDTSLQLEDIKTGSVCVGNVDTINSSGFVGSCSFSSSGSRNVAGKWQLSGDRVTGTLSVTV